MSSWREVSRFKRDLCATFQELVSLIEEPKLLLHEGVHLMRKLFGILGQPMALRPELVRALELLSDRPGHGGCSLGSVQLVMLRSHRDPNR